MAGDFGSCFGDEEGSIDVNIGSGDGVLTEKNKRKDNVVMGW